MALTDCRTILNFETTAKMSPSDGYFVIVFILHQGQFIEEESQIMVSLQTVGLGGFDKAVNGCAGLCPTGMAGEQPVLPFMWNST